MDDSPATPKNRLPSLDLIMLGVAILLPAADLVLPTSFRLADLMRPIIIFAIMGLGLNIVTGFTGLLNLGSAAFMAIGSYAYAILTCEVYPYRMGFWGGTGLAIVIGALAGVALGAPTLRLRGDYIAIVTLGFCEIVQDSLKNLDSITKGSQGINPLPPPTLPGIQFTPDAPLPWYYLFLAILAGVVWFNRNLESSRIGRSWIAVREDELAASCMGIQPVKVKLLAFAVGAGICSLAGALWVSALGAAEPSNFDFNFSIMALCVVIVGGMGNISGVIVGAVVMLGMDSIVVTKTLDFLKNGGYLKTESVYANPSSWKFLLFGMTLILMMRFKPEGLVPSRRVKLELHRAEPPDPKGSEA